MNNYLLYLSKVSCVFIALYTIYYLLFRQLTFHKANRWLLLVILPVSLMLPGLNIRLNPSTARVVTVPRFSELETSSQPDVITADSVAVAADFDAGRILFAVYCIGVVIFALRFVISSFKLVRLKQRSNSVCNNGYTIVSAEIPSAFSCFNWIFVPWESVPDHNHPVIQHEKLHADMGHTVDLILTELYIAFFWFNPFVYFFRESIRSVHEYQVDAAILQNGVRKSHYLELMLANITGWYRTDGLHNYFNGTTIKKRVSMITKNKTSKVKMLRYFLFLPAIALITLSFSSVENEVPSFSPTKTPMLLPIKKGEYSGISKKFGWVTDPVYHTRRLHGAIDFVAPKGTSVIATGAGKVTNVSTDKGHGKFIIIDHGGGFQSLYSHLDNFNVKENELVTAGQTIGFVGNTGKSTGNHLHFEIYKDNKPVDPLLYVKE